MVETLQICLSLIENVSIAKRFSRSNMEIEIGFVHSQHLIKFLKQCIPINSHQWILQLQHLS